MPAPVTDAAEKLRKLGQRLRKGIAAAHPISERSLATVKQAVRAEWQREQAEKQKAARTPKPRSPSKGRTGPDLER